MATLAISVQTTVIDTLVTTDAEIQTAIRAFGTTISNVYGFSVIPISNTKARVIMAYDEDGG